MNDRDFWRFAYERQRIWYVRTVLGHEVPWTTDPVLRRYRFCNVQRELDRGTQYIIQQLNAHLNAPQSIRLWNVMLMRYFNRPDVPWVDSCDEGYAMVAERLTWPKGIFTNTWMPMGGPRRGRPFGDELQEAITTWDAELFAREVETASSLEDVYAAVLRRSLFGPVNGWQVALDVTYTSHLTDDEWIPEVRPLTNTKTVKDPPPHGPAVAAAAILDAPFQTVVRKLRDEQDERLEKIGVSWSDVAWCHKPRLTLADVEHTLCEWQKYRAHQAGRGRKRLFRPHS